MAMRGTGKRQSGRLSARAAARWAVLLCATHCYADNAGSSAQQRSGGWKKRGACGADRLGRAMNDSEAWTEQLQRAAVFALVRSQLLRRNRDSRQGSSSSSSRRIAQTKPASAVARPKPDPIGTVQYTQPAAGSGMPSLPWQRRPNQQSGQACPVHPTRMKTQRLHHHAMRVFNSYPHPTKGSGDVVVSAVRVRQLGAPSPSRMAERHYASMNACALPTPQVRAGRPYAASNLQVETESAAPP